MGYYYKRLRDLREDNDYKQKDIAEYLKIRQEYYSKYELGKIEIPAHMIIELAKLYNVSTDYILGLTKDPTKNWTNKKKVLPPMKSNNIENILNNNTGNIGDVNITQK